MNKKKTAPEEAPFTHGQTFEHRGGTFRFTTQQDNGYAGWKRVDGFGVIISASPKEAKPHERTLRHAGGYYWHYDIDESRRVARKMITSMSADDGSITPAIRAKQMVDADFEAMLSWFRADPGWIGVRVTALDANGIENSAVARTLWRLRANAGPYLNTVARRLADELLSDIAINPQSIQPPREPAQPPPTQRIVLQVRTRALRDGLWSAPESVAGLDINPGMPEGLEVIGKIEHGDFLTFKGEDLKKLVLWAQRRLIDDYGITIEDLIGEQEDG
jgi:hypothetical protein